MTHPELIERITRSLAYMLRHQPEQFDLELDEYGFADMEDVIQALNERLGEPVEEEDVRVAVESGDRIRYEIAGGRVRALYGHSIEVKPGESAKPPTLLYVGVSKGDAERAHRYGLRPGRRSFLHLALNPDDALETGRRASRDYVVITVHALDAWEEGINFYDRKSLFLSDPIPTHFLQVGDVHTDGYATFEGQRAPSQESDGPPQGRGRPRDDRGGRGRRPRGGRGRRGGFDRPGESDPARRHPAASDDAPRHDDAPRGAPRRDEAPVGSEGRDSRPAFEEVRGRHESHGRHAESGHGRPADAGHGRHGYGGRGRHSEVGPARHGEGGQGGGYGRHADGGAGGRGGHGGHGGHGRHPEGGQGRQAEGGYGRPADAGHVRQPEGGHGRHGAHAPDDRRGRPDSRPPQREFQEDRGRPRGNGAPRDDAPRERSRSDAPPRSDAPQRPDRPMREDRAPAHGGGAPERQQRPAPVNESSGGGGFGLGIFEPKPPSVRPSAPLPREKPAAEKPRETPRPQRDEGGSFGAGIE